MVRPFKIIVEKHADGYVAYPFGLRGVVVGEGDTFDEALADVNSAIAFHIQTFEVLEREPPVPEAFFPPRHQSLSGAPIPSRCPSPAGDQGP